MRFPGTLLIWLVASAPSVAFAKAVPNHKIADPPTSIKIPPSADCEDKRKEMHKHVHKVLGLPQPVEGKVLNLEDPEIRDKIHRRQCRNSKFAPANQEAGSPCEAAYTKIIETVMGADKFIGIGCNYLEKAAQKQNTCKTNEALCYKAAAANLTQAEKHLLVASKMLDSGSSQLKEVRLKNREVARRYAGTLAMIAGRIRLLARQGVVLEINDPQLENYLGTKIDKVEGVTVKQLMDFYGIQKVDADLFTSKGRIISQEIATEESGHVAGGEASGVFASQQLRAASSAYETISFSENEVKRLASTSTELHQQAAALESLSTRLASLPAQADPSKNQLTPRSPGSPAQPTEPATRVASSGTENTNATSSSRALDLASLGAANAPKTMERHSPALLEGVQPEAPAPRAATAIARSSQSKKNVSLEPSGKTARGPASLPAEDVEKPDTKAPAEKKHVLHQVLVEASSIYSATQYPSASAPALNPALASSPLVAATENTTIEPEASDPSASKGKIDNSLPTLDEEVENRLAKLENGRKFSPGLRELIRRRLLNSDRKALTGPNMEALTSTGSTTAIKGTLQDMELVEAISREEFGMNAQETEAEIRRLMDGISDASMQAGFLSARSDSLFTRVSSTISRLAREQRLK